MTPAQQAAVERLQRGVLSCDDRVAVKALIDAQAARIAELEAKNRAGPKRDVHGAWPLEVREAIDALEDRFDIGLVSSDHHERHVMRADAAEARNDLKDAILTKIKAIMEKVDE